MKQNNPFNDPELHPCSPAATPSRTLAAVALWSKCRGALSALKLNASLSQLGPIWQDPQLVMQAFWLDLGFCKE